MKVILACPRFQSDKLKNALAVGIRLMRGAVANRLRQLLTAFLWMAHSLITPT
jgi:hypothetical protein